MSSAMHVGMVQAMYLSHAYGNANEEFIKQADKVESHILHSVAKAVVDTLIKHIMKGILFGIKIGRVLHMTMPDAISCSRKYAYEQAKLCKEELNKNAFLQEDIKQE